MNTTACIRIFWILAYCFNAYSCSLSEESPFLFNRLRLVHNLVASCTLNKERAFYSNRLRLVHGLLVENLIRFLSGESGIPVTFEPIRNLDVISIDFFANQLEYLDTKSINTFGLASKDAQRVKNNLIISRLSKIHEHFVFKEDWFNDLFYSVIKTRISAGIKSTNPDIYDYIELLTVDYITNSGNVNIPKHLHLAIISFIHNIFYGPHAVVPLTLDDWIYSIGTKVLKNHLPLTLEYIQSAFPKTTYSDLKFISLHCRTLEDLAK